MSEPVDKDFVDWLLEEMGARDWSQSDMARHAGLSRQAISDYINRKRVAPDAEAVVSIARAFKLPPEYVFRIAGLLPPADDDPQPPGLLEIIEIWRNASEEQRDEMLRHARWRAERAQEERTRAKRRRPATG